MSRALARPRSAGEEEQREDKHRREDDGVPSANKWRIGLR